MDNEERRYLVRCPYCGHTSGLITTLEMYQSKFWSTRCSRLFTLDPLRNMNPREKITRYNDI